MLDALAERLLLLDEHAPPASGTAFQAVDEHGQDARATETRVLLAAGGRAAPALQKGLRAREARVRLRAVNLLAQLPASDEIVQDLIARAQDKDRAVRLAALKALDDYGPLAAKAHPALAEIAANENDAALKRAAELAALNVSRAPGQPRHRSPLEAKNQADLLALLRDAGPGVRREAAEALRGRSDDTGAVAAALLDALDDKDESVRSAAARSLVAFGRYCPRGAAQAGRLAGNRPARLAQGRAGGARRHGRRGQTRFARGRGAGALPAADDDESLRSILAIVLQEIGPDAAPLLAEKLKSPEAALRARAAEALGSMKTVGAPAIPELVELVQERGGLGRASGLRRVAVHGAGGLFAGGGTVGQDHARRCLRGPAQMGRLGAAGNQSAARRR